MREKIQKSTLKSKLGICNLHKSLLRNKSFLLKFLTPKKVSKFAIFLWKENPKLLFPYLILCYFIFFPSICICSIINLSKNSDHCALIKYLKVLSSSTGKTTSSLRQSWHFPGASASLRRRCALCNFRIFKD